MPEKDALYFFNDSSAILIFDSAPLLAGFDLSKLNAFCFTTSSIIKEIKNKNAHEKIDLAIELGKLKIIDPPNEYINKIDTKAKESGDLKVLSPNDKSILGLALYLLQSYSSQFKLSEDHVNLKIITDDFSLQNVARSIHIQIGSYKTQGTEKFIQWEAYCPLCFKVYPTQKLGTECVICGGIIKRRAKKLKNDKKSMKRC
jgi:UPF0271 protein